MFFIKFALRRNKPVECFLVSDVCKSCNCAVVAVLCYITGNSVHIVQTVSYTHLDVYKRQQVKEGSIQAFNAVKEGSRNIRLNLNTEKKIYARN